MVARGVFYCLTSRYVHPPLDDLFKMVALNHWQDLYFFFSLDLHQMIFINIASFLPLALTLFSLDAVTAISVPKSVDSGQLNRRNPGDLTFINYFNVPESGL